MTPSDPKYRAALAIAQTLRDAGAQAFFAGGCVRDLLLGVIPKDYDVATSAAPDQVVGLFPKTVAVGAHFGVILVCQTVSDENAAGADIEIATEVATFRNDGAYSDGRRPDAVRFSADAREDVLRRDFTINGMLLDPLTYEATAGDAAAAVIDYVHGREDLAAGIIRAIGDAKLRFAEDKLRMLRAARFAARLNYRIEDSTAAAIHCHAADIHQVSQERVRDELTRILTDGAASRGFDLLYSLGLLARVLPEVVRLRGVAQPPEFHPEGDVWVHTMLLLERLPPGCSVTLAWGALLHDIGKPATYQPPNPKVPGDRIRLNGHVEPGVRSETPAGLQCDACLGRAAARHRQAGHLSAAQPQGPGRPHPLQRPRRSWRPHRRRNSCPPALLERGRRPDHRAGKEPHALRRPAGDARVDAETLPASATLRRASGTASPRCRVCSRRPAPLRLRLPALRR